MLECGDIRENIDFNLHIFGFRDVPSGGGGMAGKGLNLLCETMCCNGCFDNA